MKIMKKKKNTLKIVGILLNFIKFKNSFLSIFFHFKYYKIYIHNFFFCFKNCICQNINQMFNNKLTLFNIIV